MMVYGYTNKFWNIIKFLLFYLSPKLRPNPHPTLQPPLQLRHLYLEGNPQPTFATALVLLNEDNDVLVLSSHALTTINEFLAEQ